jgi:hypothetical protein
LRVGIVRRRSYTSVLVIPRRKTSLCGKGAHKRGKGEGEGEEGMGGGLGGGSQGGGGRGGWTKETHWGCYARGLLCSVREEASVSVACVREKENSERKEKRRKEKKRKEKKRKEEKKKNMKFFTNLEISEK